MGGVLNFAVNCWSCWFPNIETRSDLEDWLLGNRQIAQEGSPKVTFLPSLIRRRLSEPCRTAIELAYRTCRPDIRSSVRSIFASRYGEQKTSVELLQNIAAAEVFSPTAFSHSVHNTAAGYFSIAAKNRSPSTSIAANRETLLYALVEAALLLERFPDEQVFVNAVTPPLEPMYHCYADEQLLHGGVGFLVGRTGAIPLQISFAQSYSSSPRDPSREQFITQFVRWMASSDSDLALEGDRHRWMISSSADSKARFALFTDEVL